MRTALWRIARRHQALDEEIKEADREIGPLVTQAAPTLIATTAAATTRPAIPHTIVRGGLKYARHTQEYIARRTAEGMAEKDIVRCLKRFVARRIYRHLPHMIRTPEPLRQTAEPL
ncbi:hypothetical protein ACFW6E_34110 [Streptomyces olivaceoviridis]|uniref:hypothetical protein n=1 Tax=Streptomyces olivaceoviridis TaxID=1921 RepID=UPI00368F3179